MRALRTATRPPPGGLCTGGRHPARERGFTLVELMMVMMLIAIVTAMSAARFADREPFAVQGAADQLVSGLRLAQATAVAQRREVHVRLARQPATLKVCLDAACKLPLSTPAGDSTWLADAGDLTLSLDTGFSFQPDGSTSLAAALQVKVLGRDGAIASPAITVEAGSGHVHTP